MKRNLALALVMVSTLTFARPAQADPPAPAPSAASSPGQAGSWGWLLVGSSFVVGGAVTTYGLTFDCSNSDVGCQKRASLAIWGGVGIAALGSAVGLAIVETEAKRVQVVSGAVAGAAGPSLGLGVRASF